MVLVPHFRVPLEFVGGRLATVEQDSPDEVAQCVEAVLRYRRGERLTDPEFGIDDPTFRNVPATGMRFDDIAEAIARWEPRLSVLIEQSAVSVGDAIMGVALRVRATEGTPGA
jgi:phage baseplate assembly protein W